MLAEYSFNRCLKWDLHREDHSTDRSTDEELLTAKILISSSETTEITPRIFKPAEKRIQNTTGQFRAANSKKRFQRKNRQSVYSHYWQILRNLKKINSGLWWCVIKLSHMQIDSYFWRHKPFFQDSYPVSRLKTCPVGKEYRKMRHCCKSQDCRVDIPSSLQKEVKSMHQGDPLCRSWVQSICTWSESGMRRHGAHIMC